MNRIIITALFLFVAWGLNHAFAAPISCPSLTAIQKVSFSWVERSDAFLGRWYVMQLGNSYDTDRKWDFSVVVKAQDQKEALANAALALKNLLSPSGPSSTGVDSYICQYNLASAVLKQWRFILLEILS